MRDIKVQSLYKGEHTKNLSTPLSILVLPEICKLLENLVPSQMFLYLIDELFLSPECLALDTHPQPSINVAYVTLGSSAQGHRVGAVLIDLSKALNLLNCDLLLQLIWFNSNLTEWRKCHLCL